MAWPGTRDPARGLEVEARQAEGRVEGDDRRRDILARARAEGFDIAGFTRPDIPPRAAARLDDFIAGGEHGDMGWMEETLARRRDPAALWPRVRSVLVVGANYGPHGDPMDLIGRPERATISVYAQGRDYHDTMKRRLRRLGAYIHRAHAIEVKLFVDTAPVMEKPLAQSAGIGWVGKHTNLVSRRFGSWLFLGEIFLDTDLATDAPERDHCGTCRQCIDACPTGAITGPYRLDARRCISYLTIEHKGHIPEAFRAAMGNRIYGCDDCLAVCPWNKYARPTDDSDFFGRIETSLPALQDFAALDDAAFRQVFAGSPVKRTGRDRFMRNVLIAIGNSGLAELVPAAYRHLSDPSPLVRAMAVWALSRLLPGDEFRRLAEARRDREDDADVRAEWRAGQSIAER